MKKFILTAAMGVLLFVGLTSMSHMAAPNYDCKGYCEVYGSYFTNQGACQSYCSTCTNSGKGNTAIVCACKYYQAVGVLDALGLSFGDCVQILKGH